MDGGGGGDGPAGGPSDCLGADTLLQLLKNYARNQKLKTAITVGVVGLPNVGKSSLINSLKRARVANVGATPGVTRSLQEVQLDKHVRLLDCPGVVLSAATREGEAAAALRNAIKIETLKDPVTPVRQILNLCRVEQLMLIYKIARYNGVDEFLLSVAFARGKLKKGGVPDIPAAAKVVLRDWNEGKIPFYTVPPVRASGVSKDEEAAIVAEWGKEFNVEEVFQEEHTKCITVLPSLADSGRMFTQLESGAPVTMAVDGGDEEEEEEEEELGDEEEEDEEGSSGGEAMEAEEGDEEQPEEDVMDASEKLTKKKQKKAAASKQEAQLYDAEGILNPQLLRSAKKKKKKQAKLAAVSKLPRGAKLGRSAKPSEDPERMEEDGEGSDYDFNSDFQ